MRTRKVYHFIQIILLFISTVQPYKDDELRTEIEPADSVYSEDWPDQHSEGWEYHSEGEGYEELDRETVDMGNGDRRSRSVDEPPAAQPKRRMRRPRTRGTTTERTESQKPVDEIKPSFEQRSSDDIAFSELVSTKKEDLQPLFPPPSHTLRKNRYLLRLKEDAIKNITKLRSRTDDKDSMFTATARELERVFNKLTKYVQEDGNFYFDILDEEAIRNEMDFMYYELVKDPQTYLFNASLHTEDITSQLGGVNKTIAALLKENPSNSTLVKWYIDELYQRSFGKKLNSSHPKVTSQESVEEGTGIVPELMSNLILEISVLVNDTRRKLSELPVADTYSTKGMVKLVEAVSEISTSLSSLDTKVQSGISSVAEKVKENSKELKKFASSLSDLKVYMDDNKRTLNGLYTSVNSLSGVSMPLYQKLEEVCSKQSSCREETLHDIEGILKDIKNSVTNVKNLTNDEQSMKNYTSALLISLGSFIKSELEQVRNDSRGAYDLIQKSIQASINTNVGITNSVRSAISDTTQELARRISNTHEQLMGLTKSFSSMEANLAEVEKTVKESSDDSRFSTVQQHLLYITSAMKLVVVQLSELSNTFRDKTDVLKNQTVTSVEELSKKLREVVKLQSSLESQEREKTSMLSEIKMAVTSNNDQWQSRFKQVLDTVSSINKGSTTAIEEVKEYYQNQTRSMVSGLQYCTVAATMQHQILSEMNRTLVNVEEKIDNFMTRSNAGFMDIAKVIASVYTPQAKSGDECSTEDTVTKIMENLNLIIESKLQSRSLRPFGRAVNTSASNLTKLDDDDIRYNFEDLIWVLKACHTSDPALCGYAWCAKVCGFNCPFNCKRYVSCFKKFAGNKEMTRDCYAGLDDTPVKIPPSEISLKIQCTDALVSGREVGVNLAAFETSGGNFFKKQVSVCNIAASDKAVNNATSIKGYTILVSSCMKCREHIEDWDGANVTRLINYIEANCTEYSECNGMTADPTKICCTDYPCPGKDKESCCERACLAYYRSPHTCYKPKILVSSPYVKNHDLTSGSRIILGSLFVGKSVEISITFPEKCIVPGFQMIVAGMTQLPKGKHPGQKSNIEEPEA